MKTFKYSNILWVFSHVALYTDSSLHVLGSWNCRRVFNQFSIFHILIRAKSFNSVWNPSFFLDAHVF